jgi:hypothetical protein
MVAGNLVAGENYLFMYNGVNFTSTIPPIPLQPPQTTFYVRPDGNDNNSGFANDPADAFLTIQGAINQIKSRYMSLNTITIRVADGTYTSGAADGSSYIAAWSIIGNASNPSACTVDCRSTSSASYISGSSAGTCFETFGSCQMSVQGFNMLSYYENCGSAGGTLSLNNNFHNPPVAAGPVMAATNGSTTTFGGTNNQYNGGAATECFFASAAAGNIKIGDHSIYGSAPVTMNIIGSPTFTDAFAVADTGGIIYIAKNAPVNWTSSVPHCAQFNARTGGGVWFYDGGIVGFPGDQPGVVTSPGWTA